MQQVAQSSGLQWVQSDADKVAAIQTAIAAEPRPVHTPRMRPPAVVLDDGPLVSGETRRDLARDMQPSSTSRRLPGDPHEPHLRQCRMDCPA